MLTTQMGLIPHFELIYVDLKYTLQLKKVIYVIEV